jgi:hypothetical protein
MGAKKLFRGLWAELGITWSARVVACLNDIKVSSQIDIENLVLRNAIKNVDLLLNM